MQSVFCAPCVYSQAYEKATGGQVPGEDWLGCVPVPATTTGKCLCCLMSVTDIVAPVIGVFSIRTSNDVGQGIGWACALEFCPWACCYGSPCHMNAYRKDMAYSKVTSGGIL